MEQKSHFLYPSTLFASREPYIVNTILGSCVSVCLYDSTTQIGGINHYMLPFWNGEGLASPKFGNIAIEKLLEKMLAMGCNKNNIIAKVFGGGEVIETQITQFHIGERNISVAQQVLKELKINITGQSLGGKNGRKIQFNTQTGSVLQKIIPKQSYELKTQ
jgi:chemotaxis protein CheD